MMEPIARIEEALTRLGAEHKPPVGWEARVLAAAAKPKPKPWWWFAFPVVALAVIAIVLFFRGSETPLQLALSVEKGAVAVRGTSAHVGDIVHATATGGGHHRVVWVYRDDHLVMACPGGPQCRRDGEAMVADVVLDTTGEYTIVALTSKSAMPAPSGTLDTDIGMALNAGASETRKQLTVH